MEKKNNGKGIVILLTLFIVISLGLILFIAYDKILNKSENKETELKNKTETKELDINSRLVQSLYQKVKPNGPDGDCTFGWIYYADDNIDATEDFYVKNGAEKIKMKIVSQNLSVEELKSYLCGYGYNGLDATLEEEAKKIPDTNSEGRKSACRDRLDNKTKVTEGTQQYYYNKDYIEKVYKDIYGPNQKLDTSVPLITDQYNIMTYYYVKELDKYILYPVEGGGSCGPNGSKEELVKAEQKGKELKIHVNFIVITYEEKENHEINYDKTKEEKTPIVYTFKLEEDGMYSFVSRVKEK